MPSFSNKSKERLVTCDQRLQMLCFDAIAIVDFVVLCGYRGKEEQEAAFAAGTSPARWGQSLHNKMPSKAVDLAPYPIDWNNRERFAELAGVIKAVAYKHNIKIKWGGDFEKFCDMPHFELED